MNHAINTHRPTTRSGKMALMVALAGGVPFALCGSGSMTRGASVSSSWRNQAGNDGKWNTGANWNPTGAPNNQIPPGTTYDVTITGNAAVSVTLDAAVTVDKLNLDATLGNTGFIQQIGKTLSMGEGGALAVGSYVLKDVDRKGALMVGTAVAPGEFYVGRIGTGTVTQLGHSTVVVDGTITLADAAFSTGTYNLGPVDVTTPAPDPSLTTTTTVVGGSGTGNFFLNYGKHIVKQRLVIGEEMGEQEEAAGTYTMRRGLLKAHEEVVGRTGRGQFFQNGGVHQVEFLTLAEFPDGVAGLDGAYQLSNGDLLVGELDVGGLGTAEFIQSGGTNIISGTLTINDRSIYEYAGGKWKGEVLDNKGTVYHKNKDAKAEDYFEVIDNRGKWEVTPEGRWWLDKGVAMAVRQQTIQVDAGGEMRLSGAGGIVASDGATFDNNGTFTVDGDAPLVDGGGAPAFNNHGTFRKSAGAGVSLVTVPFESPGTVDVQTGTVSLNGPVSSRGYYFTKDGPGTLAVRGPQSYGQAGQTNVTLNVNAGTMALYTDAGAGYGKPYVVVGGLGPAATLSLHSTQHLLGATVSLGGTVALAPAATRCW